MRVFNRQFHPDKQTVVFFLTIGLLAVGGIWSLAYSTPLGLGINDDSIAYIAGARSILNGNGYRQAWLASNGPVTHFPPGFPAVLSLIGFITGLDPVRGARALNGLLFGLNIALTGWVGWRMTASRLAGVLAAALILLNSSLLYIHTRAMSEPLYLFLMLVSFLLLDYYFERPKIFLLVALGFTLAWAYLARYAAVSLLATVIAALLVLHANWRERLKSALIVSASALPWILGWSIRNRVVGGSFTNRVLGWHPITLDNWELGVKTFAEFLVPLRPARKVINQIPASFEIILITTGLLLVILVLYKGWPHFARPAQAHRPAVLAFTHMLYVIAYMSVLVLTMTLFDPATKFQVRILSPTYISLLLLPIVFGTWLWRKKQVFWKPVIILCAVGLLSIFAAGQVAAVQDFRKGGDVFAGERWSESEAIAALEQFPQDVLILTNEPGVVYLYTGRPSATLPKEEPEISAIKQSVLDGEIVIVLFRVNRADSETLDYFLQLGYGLYQSDYRNTWIFSAFPK
jgi:4-amino-4-deoxy-L-arabinose transferase-like glycosyltransferase